MLNSHQIAVAGACALDVHRKMLEGAGCDAEAAAALERILSHLREPISQETLHMLRGWLADLQGSYH